MEPTQNPRGDEAQRVARPGKQAPGRPGRAEKIVLDWHPVMREQLEYLMDHAAHGFCGCGECQRYLRVRTALLEIFRDRPGKPA